MYPILIMYYLINIIDKLIWEVILVFLFVIYLYFSCQKIVKIDYHILEIKNKVGSLIIGKNIMIHHL
jgi:hypothetical protein